MQNCVLQGNTEGFVKSTLYKETVPKTCVDLISVNGCSLIMSKYSGLKQNLDQLLMQVTQKLSVSYLIVNTQGSFQNNSSNKWDTRKQTFFSKLI